MPDGIAIDYDARADPQQRRACGSICACMHGAGDLVSRLHRLVLKTMAPRASRTRLSSLRTAVGVGSDNWSQIRFRPHAGIPLGRFARASGGRPLPSRSAPTNEPAWQEVPGEYRAMLRRLLVIQGDTEPASVEQQRHLGATAPSLYDMRNLFAGQCRGRPPPLGHGILAAEVLRP